MAQPIYCDQDGCGQPGDFMVSNLNDGAVVALCGPHMLGWCQAFLTAFAEVEAEEDQAADIAPPMGTDDGAPPTVSARRQRPKSEAAQPAEVPVERAADLEQAPTAPDTG